MTTSQSVVPQQQANVRALDRYTDEEKELLRSQLAKNCTDAEIAYGLTVAQTLGLNPFARQIYMIKYGGQNPKMQLIIAVDGYRAIAGRDQDARGIQTYAGSDAATFGPPIEDRETVLGWHPEWAEVKVYKMLGNNRVPFTGRVYWEGRARYDFNRLGDRWKQDPRGMLAKCAEVAALRQGWQLQMESLVHVDADYIDAEYRQVDEPAPSAAPVVDYPADSVYTPPAPEPLNVDPDLAGLLDFCPAHENTPWQKGDYGYYHKTAEKKVATAGRSKGKEVPVTCYRKTVLAQRVVAEAEVLHIDTGVAGGIIRDHFGGKGVADLTDEEKVKAIHILRHLNQASTSDAATTAVEPAAAGEGQQEAML